MARLLARAAAPGRMRGIGMELYSRARCEPVRAGRTLREGLRKARALHSRERRFVADMLHDLVRHGALLEHILESRDPTALWLGWLVHLGLSPADASEQWTALSEAPPPPFERVTALPGDADGPTRAGMTPEVWTEVERSLGAQSEAFLAASNQRAPVWLRANPRRCDGPKLVAALEAHGVAARTTPRLSGAVEVLGRTNLQAMPEARAGWFEVQDLGSQALAALVPGHGPGLDLCAGAGGKSLAVACRGAGPVWATDIRDRALAELRRRAKRAGARIHTHTIRTGEALPAQIPPVRWVLVDAPCTGLGVLHRHPEHRWLATARDLLERPRVQRALLEIATTRIQPGGWLIYGTCSVLSVENEDVIEHFLAAHPEYRVVPATERVPWADRFLRTAPHSHDADGFFGAILEHTG